MDVNNDTFWNEFPNLMTGIVSADFVAIDFEFSGVASHVKRDTSRNSLQSLQDRYDEVKAAAEKFQVLQVGITTAQSTLSSSAPVSTSTSVPSIPSTNTTPPNNHDIPSQGHAQLFHIKTWNINLTPLVNEDLGIDRDFILQNGAAHFLLENQFNFHKPLANGVPYLSRKEEAQAYENLQSKQDPNRFREIQLQSDDTAALEFVERVRNEIKKWIKRGKRKHNLTISSLHGPLSRFDRRLVYQLLRCEFPALFARPNGPNMIIGQIDPVREQQIVNSRRKRLVDQINQNIGFRWIIEALCKGNLANLPCHLLLGGGGGGGGVDNDGKIHDNDNDWQSDREFISSLENLRETIIEKLGKKRPVLVGHNIFGDLMYFYQNFLGDLPETVENFGVLIQDLIPLVIDTKYMATHYEFGLSGTSSLEHISTLLKNEKYPEIILEPGYKKYEEMEASHEAGYDSYQTALVMIRLAVKISNEQESKTENRVQKVPPFGDSFWDRYRNKLRIFGTVEKVLDLNPIDMSCMSTSTIVVESMISLPDRSLRR